MSASTGTGIATSTGIGADVPAAPGAGLPPAGPAVRARRLTLPRSPKIVAGAGMLVVFVVFAVIGPWIAPYDPSASVSTTNGVPQPPSAAHWLGTTQVQQDVFSQLLTGGRSTILVAFLAGAVATVLAVLIGVTAGLPRRARRRPALDAGQHLPGAAGAAAADRDLRLPAQLRRWQRPADRADHRR